MNTFATLLLLTLNAQTPDVRPEIDAEVRKADKLLGDFEEQKAVDLLTALSKRKDLDSAELSFIELHRGIAFMAINRKDEADGAFSTARGCNGLAEPPPGVSPKIRAVFNSAVPLDCPVGSRQAADPTEKLPTPVVAKARQPAAAPVERAPSASAENGEGLSTLVKAGAGVAVGGGVLLVLAVVGAVAGGVAFGASYPLQAQARAAEMARDAREQSQRAFIVRIAGGAILALAGTVGLASVAALAGGVVTAIVGVTR